MDGWRGRRTTSRLVVANAQMGRRWMWGMGQGGTHRRADECVCTPATEHGAHVTLRKRCRSAARRTSTVWR